MCWLNKFIDSSLPVTKNTNTFIIMPHCMRSTDPAYCDRCHTYSGLCVCVSVFVWSNS